MRLFAAPTALLFLRTTVLATGPEDCGYQADLINDAPTFEADPITILAQTTDEVTFSLSQTWSDDMLCFVAAHYLADNGYQCPTTANAAAGEFAEYTAQCQDGYANVDVYVYDPTLLDNTETVVVPDICESTLDDKTYVYQFRIPCALADSCAPTEEEQCTDTALLEYDFEDAGDVQAWLFGQSGGDVHNHFLKLDAELPEVSKTFVIPADTQGMTFEFDFLTEQFAEEQKVLIRVGDYYLNTTAALKLPTDGAGKTEYYGEAEVHLERVDTSTVRVAVKIPESLYHLGYISLGVRTYAGSSTFSAGVDNVKVQFDCFVNSGTKSGGGGGDPHFQRWGREHSSFHGECDLIMLHSDDFHSRAGLDLHVRTTIQDYFSFIETAALRVGQSVLEFHKDHFYLDGTKYSPLELPLTFGGKYSYTISNPPIGEGKNPRFYQYFQVDLNQDSTILFKYYKKYLTISIHGHARDFVNSVGLLGDYRTGNMLSRDGNIMSDFDQYGFEWQVNSAVAKLFVDNRAPQLPFEQCRMPTAARPVRRKLRGADAVLFDEAAEACSHLKGSNFDLCIDDVMATGDVGLASVWTECKSETITPQPRSVERAFSWKIKQSCGQSFVYLGTSVGNRETTAVKRLLDLWSKSFVLQGDLYHQYLAMTLPLLENRVSDLERRVQQLCADIDHHVTQERALLVRVLNRRQLPQRIVWRCPEDQTLPALGGRPFDEPPLDDLVPEKASKDDDSSGSIVSLPSTSFTTNSGMSACST